MSSFKKRAIERLKADCNQSEGIIQATIYSCIRIIEGIPDDENCGEKACAPNYEAECKRLSEQQIAVTDEKNECELMLQKAYQEIHNLKSMVARLEGFRDGVILGINARNRLEDKKLSNCCNRMEDSYE